MEIITLISLNLVFGMGLYMYLVARMNRMIRESQGSKLQEKIQKFYNLYMHEANTQIEILEAKARGLRDLILRSEKILGELKEESIEIQELRDDLEKHLRESRSILSHKVSDFASEKESSASNLPFPSTPVMDNLQKIQKYKENEPRFPLHLNENPEDRDSAIGLIAGIGKKVKEMIGIENYDFEKRAEKLGASLSRNQKSENSLSKTMSRMEISIEGNPFDDLKEEETIRNLTHSEEGNFLSTLKQSLNEDKNPIPAKSIRDEVKISHETLFAELPAGATKIDKAVYLLQKNYSHSEIANILDIGTREVSLIETVRLHKNRRI